MAEDEVPIAADYGVKTELHNFYLTLGVKYVSKFFYADISGDISPAYVVSMEQSLSVPALVKDDKNSKGMHTGFLTYNFCAEAGIKFNSYIALGLRYRFDFIPYRYDQLALEGEIPVKQDELKETISVMLFSPALHLGGLYPYLGYQTMTLKNKDKIAKKTSTFKENRLVVGMAYTF